MPDLSLWRKRVGVLRIRVIVEWCDWTSLARPWRASPLLVGSLQDWLAGCGRVASHAPVMGRGKSAKAVEPCCWHKPLSTLAIRSVRTTSLPMPCRFKIFEVYLGNNTRQRYRNVTMYNDKYHVIVWWRRRGTKTWARGLASRPSTWSIGSSTTTRISNL